MDITQLYNDYGEEAVRFIREYYNDELGELIEHYPSEQDTLVIDHSDVFRWNPEVADMVRESPQLATTLFEKALLDVDVGPPIELKNANVAFVNVDEPVAIDNLTGDHVEQLVTVRGQVAKTSPVQPRLTVAGFRCQSCGQITKCPQPRHGSDEPDMCSQTGCKGQDLKPDFEESKWIPHQLIRVKQPPEEAENDENIDIHLTGDMAGKATAGDRIDVTGILKGDFGDFETPIPEFYMIGHGVELHESDYQDMDVGEKKDRFMQLAEGEEGNPYELLIGSIAPTIQGDDKLDAIKLAIALQLFGGWRRPYGDGGYVRGDSHIAIIGEAGTGKSSMLEAAETISPRSGYVSGKNATQAGITAAAVRDDFGESEWSLEAGAVVKAHKGTCCIDEIDKVNETALSSLHTALERQRLEFNKAGIDASLHAQTSILAAGNPENGQFIPEDKVLNQLNLGPTLRSRFDLIYTLRDDQVYEKDKNIAEHMMKVRQLSGLAEKGKVESADTVEPAVDLSVLRAWVAYARENIYPVFEDESRIEDVAQWFAEKRDNGEGKTMNRRIVDGVARLCEASARVRLSETIEEQDIERAKEVIEQSLVDLQLIGSDQATADITEVDTGVSQNQRERYTTVKGVIETLQPNASTGVDKETVVNTAVEAGFEKSKVEHNIQKLANKGVITTLEGEGEVRLIDYNGDS